MTVDEVKILLSDLNRGYNTPYSSAEQATIERLYYEVLGKRLSGCRCPDRQVGQNQAVYADVPTGGTTPCSKSTRTSKNTEK